MLSSFPSYFSNRICRVVLIARITLRQQEELWPVPLTSALIRSYQALSHSPQLVPFCQRAICPTQQLSETTLCLAMALPYSEAEMQLKVYSLRKQSHRIQMGASFSFLRSSSHFSSKLMSWSHSFLAESSGRQKNLTLRQICNIMFFCFFIWGWVEVAFSRNKSRVSWLSLPLSLRMLMAICSSRGLRASPLLQDCCFIVVRIVLDTATYFLLGQEIQRSGTSSGSENMSGYRKQDGYSCGQIYWKIPVSLASSRELKGNSIVAQSSITPPFLITSRTSVKTFLTFFSFSCQREMYSCTLPSRSFLVQRVPQGDVMNLQILPLVPGISYSSESSSIHSSVSWLQNLFLTTSICSTFDLSTSTPVNAQAIFSLLPANRRGIPGMVQAKMGTPDPSIEKTKGLKISGRQLCVSKDWMKRGLPDSVRFPERAMTVFRLRKVMIGKRKSLNMSVSTQSQNWLENSLSRRSLSAPFYPSIQVLGLSASQPSPALILARIHSKAQSCWTTNLMNLQIAQVASTLSTSSGRQVSPLAYFQTRGSLSGTYSVRLGGLGSQSSSESSSASGISRPSELEIGYQHAQTDVCNSRNRRIVLHRLRTICRWPLSKGFQLGSPCSATGRVGRRSGGDRGRKLS